MVNRSVLISVLCCLASAASALPKDVDHASVLPESTIHMGLLDLNYGLSETLEIGTVWPALLLGLPNASVKWQGYQNKDFQVAIRAAVFHYDNQIQNPEASPFTSTLLPLSLIGTTQWRQLTMSGELAFTRVMTTGQASSSSSQDADVISLSDVRGSLNLSTGILKTTVLWDYSPGFAWIFDAHFSLFQRAEAMGDSTFQIQVDERTSANGVIQASAGGDLTASTTARNLSASALWYWSQLHVKAGLTVGHLMIPYVNVFVVNVDGDPVSFMLPKLDVYWRF